MTDMRRSDRLMNEEDTLRVLKEGEYGTLYESAIAFGEAELVSNEEENGVTFYI